MANYVNHFYMSRTIRLIRERPCRSVTIQFVQCLKGSFILHVILNYLVTELQPSTENSRNMITIYRENINNLKVA
jgi:hypothetical protein